MAGPSADWGGSSARWPPQQTNQGRGDLDRNSGEPRRTLHKAKSVHLSFPFKTVELTNWSGTFGSHFLFLFGQWEGQEGLLKCVSTHAHSHVCSPLAQGHLPGDCLVEDTT